jgi:hypothetical protein
VFMGTPPPKPLICKSVSNRFSALKSDLRADPTGGEPRLSCAILSFATADIIKTSLGYRSQSVHLSLLPFIIPFQGNKKPCLLGVSRV